LDITGAHEGNYSLPIYTTTATIKELTIPEMIVEGNLIEIVDGDVSPSFNDHTEFGSTNIDTGTVVRTFRILNTGNATLNLDGSPIIEVGGEHSIEFAVTGNPTSTVNAEGVTAFKVTFNPSAVGTRSATIKISNNDTDEDPYNFFVQGTGTAKPAVDPLEVGSPSFTVSNLNVKPARVQSGGMVTITADVTNIGKAGGSYNGVLIINGVVETTRKLNVPAGETAAISFTVVRGVGSYDIEIDDNSAYFEVLAPSGHWIWWFLITLGAGLLILIPLLWRRHRANRPAASG
jgi:hypothetical protein